MKIDKYLERMREFLHDPEGKVWSDDELKDFLNDAAIQYCRDTGSFRSTASIQVDSTGVMKVPADYLEWVAGWNTLDQKIEAVKMDVASQWYGDFMTVKGTPRFVYEDIDSIGSFRLCPIPENSSISITIVVAGQGTPIASDYGIPSNAPSYGVATMFRSTGASVGEMVYVKSESVDKIVDYMAILYLSISMAYDVDSDFQDGGKSSMYYEQYKNRIARFGQIRRGGNPVYRGGRFF